MHRFKYTRGDSSFDWDAQLGEHSCEAKTNHSQVAHIQLHAEICSLQIAESASVIAPPLVFIREDAISHRDLFELLCSAMQMTSASDHLERSATQYRGVSSTFGPTCMTQEACTMELAGAQEVDVNCFGSTAGESPHPAERKLGTCSLQIVCSGLVRVKLQSAFAVGCFNSLRRGIFVHTQHLCHEGHAI